MRAALRQIIIIAVGVALGLVLGGLAWRGLWVDGSSEADVARRASTQLVAEMLSRTKARP